MKVVAFNIKEFEKELLAKANAKVHDLTLISNGLNFSTIHYAIGKEAVIVSDQDVLDRFLLEALSEIGVKKIITRSVSTDHIDVSSAGSLNLDIANTPSHDSSPENIAKQTITNLNTWEVNKCLGSACCCLLSCQENKDLHKKIQK